MSIRSKIPVILLVSALAGLTGCATRGDVEAMSAQEFEKMRTQMPITTNATERAYVRCVVGKVVATLPAPYNTMDWDVEVFDDEAVNAFAMAGGKIGVFNGIFQVATNQDQLAAVIGHEIAHVTEDHTMEQIQRAQVAGGAATAGSILAGAYGVDPNATYAVLDGAAQLGLMLPYGRAAEKEADLVGLDYMAAAGFDPRQSVQLWKNMAALNDGAPPEFLSTHPSPENRTGELISQMPQALVLYNEAKAKGRTPYCLPR